MEAHECESLIRYYGYYANAARGMRKKFGLEKEDEDGIDVEVGRRGKASSSLLKIAENA